MPRTLLNWRHRSSMIMMLKINIIILPLIGLHFVHMTRAITAPRQIEIPIETEIKTKN